MRVIDEERALELRKDFPLIDGSKGIYIDNAATTQVIVMSRWVR